MAEEKKDLTGIISYAKKLEESGQAPPVPEGSLMEETPIEKIDDFESLDEYSKANPMPDPQEAPPQETTPSEGTADTADTPPPTEANPLEAQETLDTHPQPSEPTPSQEASTEGSAESLTSHADSSSDPFAPHPESSVDSSPLSEDPFASSSTSPLESGAQDPFSPTPPDAEPPHTDTAFTPSTDSTSSGSDFDFSETPEQSESSSHPEESTTGEALSPEPTQPPNPAAPIKAAAQAQTTPPPSSSQQGSPQSPSTPPSGSGSGKPTAPLTPLEKVKQFAENNPSVKPKAVPASFPFSLLIEGHLSPAEKEKLLDLLSRENMGIREIDLEPQLASGRILIPRISEFAGVLLVQALRALKARMRLGPSEKIYASQATQPTPPLTRLEEDGQEQILNLSTSSPHPAEKLPITQESSIPEFPSYFVIDTLSASATLKSQWVASSSSYEYQHIIDALQKELKYKAFHRGAQALISFRIQLTPISTSTDYRLLALGTAIKALESSSPSKPPEDAQPTENTPPSLEP